MGRLILVLIVALPLLEIGTFILVGKAIGVLATLGLVIASVLVGATILRLRGLSMLARMRAALASGELPGAALADGVMVGIGAVLLIVPGFVTDVVGLLLLTPPIRRLIYRVLSRNMRVATVDVAASRGSDWNQPDTIELESDQWRDR